jgi:hypothetical protein
VPLDLDAIRDGEAVGRTLEEIYPGLAPVPTGVVHPTAVWRRPDDRLVTIKIRPEAPASRHDRFVLNASRARADAFVTTGKNLREEPELRAGLLGPREDTEPLEAWRRAVLHKPEPPLVLVLTSGRELDLTHPMFLGGRTIIFTGLEAGERLERPALEHGVETVAHPQPSIHRAIEFLRSVAGAGLVSIEAGPTTSRELYRDPVVVDEILLSVFEGPNLPPSVRGEGFLSIEEVRRAFTPSRPYRVEEPSGPWAFQRWVRN